MSATMLNRSDVINRYRTALVQIKVTGRTIEGTPAQPRLGTGVVVGADGWIITAGHVVGKNEDWKETAPGSGIPDQKVEIAGLDENGINRSFGNASVWPVPGYDVALLLIAARNLRTPTLSDQLPSETERLIALLWNPGGVPEPVDADLVPSDPRFGGQLTVRLGVIEGNSGSGLFDAKLCLAGIIVKRLDDYRALMVPIVWVKSEIDRRAQVPKSGNEDTPPGGHDTVSQEEMAAELEELRQQTALLKREQDWSQTSRANGWYELLEVRERIRSVR